MQWTGAATAGFTTGRPWLPVAADAGTFNVEIEREWTAHSMLSLYRRLIALRREEPALAIGSYTPVETEGDLLAYRREHERRRLLVVLNMGTQMQEWRTEGTGTTGRILLTTSLDREGERVGNVLQLRPDEGVIVEEGS